MIALTLLTLLSVTVEEDILPVERTPPVYPPMLNAMGIRAACAAMFDIDQTGRPRNACIRCATVSPIAIPDHAQDRVSQEFINSVRESLATWVYAPEHAGRHNVESVAEFTYPTEAGDGVEPVPDWPDLTDCRGAPVA